MYTHSSKAKVVTGVTDFNVLAGVRVSFTNIDACCMLFYGLAINLYALIHNKVLMCKHDGQLMGYVTFITSFRFVCLFVSRIMERKLLARFHETRWTVVAWAKEESIKFLAHIRTRYANDFLLQQNKDSPLLPAVVKRARWCMKRENGVGKYK